MHIFPIKLNNMQILCCTFKNYASWLEQERLICRQRSVTGSACRGVSKMANGTLQGLFLEPKHRLTDRTAFVQALSRLSYTDNSKKENIEQKRAKDASKDS